MRLMTLVIWFVISCAVVGLGACSDDGGGGGDAGADSGADSGTDTDADTDTDTDGDTDAGECVDPAPFYTADGLSLDVTVTLPDTSDGAFVFHEILEVTAPAAGSSLTLFASDFTFTSTSAPVDYDGQVATFCLPPFAAGDTLHIEVDYSVPQSIIDPLGIGLRSWPGDPEVFGPCTCPYFTSYWLLSPQATYDLDPLLDTNVAVEHFALDVIAPTSDWTVSFANGPPEQDGNHYRFALDKPAPLYALNFAASLGTTRGLVGTTPGGLAFYAVTTPADQPEIADVMQMAVPAAAWAEEHLGPHEFGSSIDLLHVPGFSVGAIENVGGIWFNSGMFVNPDSVHVPHEVIHQWLGNSMRYADFQHYWVAEGFAEWVAHYRLGDEILSAEAAAAAKLERRITAADMCVDPSSGPLRFADDADWVDQLSHFELYYSYAGAFLQMVHARLVTDFGTSLDEVLSDWYDAKKLQAVTTEELRDFLGETTDDTAYWEQLFDEWVLGSPCPALVFDSYSWDGATLGFTVSRDNESAQAIEDLEIVLDTGTATETVTVSLPAGTDLATVNVALPAEPVAIRVDPANAYVFTLDTASGWAGTEPELVAAEL
jgi:hypothetical protein